MKYKAIIFDLDGTLVNSLEDIADSMNKVLKTYNFATHELEKYNYLVGSGIRKLVIDAIPESNRDDKIVDACFKLMNEIYSQNYINKTKPYDGIIEMLNDLKSRKLKLNVLSNKKEEFTKNVVNKLLPEYFEIVKGLTNEAHKKPNPFTALQIAKDIDVEPENIIYVGDTNIDMQTANNAGMYAVGVLWGFRTKEELLQSGAKLILEQPLDILNIL